jgi:hypothetical protein
VGWSEKLIELSNSWFSPKQLLGWPRVFPLGVEHWKVLRGSNTPRSIKLRIPEIKSAGVRRWGRSSTRQKGNSLDRRLRSLNLCSVHLRMCYSFDSEEVGLEAAIL